MRGYTYLSNRLSELRSHGRKVWLRRWGRYTVCVIKEGT